MDSNIVYCGLDCAKCPIYIATKTNDHKLRKKTAQTWNMDPKKLYCSMCNSEVEPIFYWCAECPIRLCAREKEFNTCAECPDYLCDKLTEPLSKHPEQKENLDILRQKIS